VAVDSGGIPNVVLKPREADLIRSEFGWESPQFGQLWIFEHPERGLLVISVESFAGPDPVEDLNAWVESWLDSLEFIER